MATNSLVRELKKLAGSVNFEPSSNFSWSPATKTVHYDSKSLSELSGSWALIHETAHALLNHSNYSSDFNLLTMEVAAWDKAKEIAIILGIDIDENHIQDCLDTYRDWLHRRSTCPTCGCVSLQHGSKDYNCHNCNTSWQVSSARFCRPYRRRSSLASTVVTA